jgi:hypothetical protein
MSSDPVVGFRFRITRPDGRQEVLMVDAERALIGSAGHCEVRLDPELVAHEHVEVYAHAGAVHFATRQYGLATRLPTLDGATAVEGTWRPGSTLAIGNVQMTVDLVDIGTPRAKPPVWALFIMIPILVVTIGAVAFARTVKMSDPPVPDAPVLLPPKDVTSCRNAAPDQRVALANEKLRIAVSKRERSPFSPQDGFDAVLLFEGASGCYRAAGMLPDAAAAEHSADALREKEQEDYRVRRVRLEHAYLVHDTPAVKRELAVLMPMTSQQRGPYTDWLAALNRAATAELEAKGRLSP